MLITKKSMLTGDVHSKDINVTRDQLNRYEGGELFKDVFNNLTPSERDFIIAGVTSDEWDTALKNSPPNLTDIQKLEWPDAE